VKRGFMTSNELDALPEHLERGEQIVRITRASLGWRAGVLVVTNRRLLFLYLDDLVIDASLWEVSVISHHAENSWSGDKLVLGIGTENRAFTDIEGESLEDLVSSLERAAGAAD
jgi:hypothetical protein